MNPYSIRAQSSQTIQMKEGIQFFERQKGQLLTGLTKAATSSNSKEDIFIEMTEPYEETNSQTMELKVWNGEKLDLHKSQMDLEGDSRETFNEAIILWHKIIYCHKF
jgi:hypothetical protein